MAMTRIQSRAVDEWAINQLGVPSLVLMENAGLNAAGAILDVIDEHRLSDTLGAAAVDGQALGDVRERDSVLILAGPGNNGGDGYVIARHLSMWGVDVRIIEAEPEKKYTSDAAVNRMICQNLKIPVFPYDPSKFIDQLASADIIVDALLGTGLTSPPRPPYDGIIEAVNQLPALMDVDSVVVAIDTPTGLDVDTGLPQSPTIQADMTVTFVDRKVGFDVEESLPYTGRVVVADIGVPVSRAMADNDG